MSEWQWFLQFEQEALRCGDRDRSRLLQIHDQGFAYRETNPDQTLALFREGQQLAERLEEPWWVMLFQQWQVHATIYYKRDFRNLLDQAIHNLLTVQKPAHLAYPQRLHAYTDLIVIYLRIDPLGYCFEIRSALDELERELSHETPDSHYMWNECRIDLAFAQEDYARVAELTIAALGEADSDPDQHAARHYMIAMHENMCLLEYHRRNWEGLERWAVALESSGRYKGYQYPIALAQMWQALLAEKQGQQTIGSRQQRTALGRNKQLEWPACPGYYHAWCHYHMLRGEFDEALEVRERQFEKNVDKGQLAYECDILIDKCRLLDLIGRLDDENVEAAHRAAQRLRKPEFYIGKIEAITAGRETLEL